MLMKDLQNMEVDLIVPLVLFDVICHQRTLNIFFE